VQGRLRCPPRQRRVHAGRWASTQGREGGEDSFVLIQNVARNRVKSCSQLPAGRDRVELTRG
jgi:hypothetical protein